LPPAEDPDEIYPDENLERARKQRLKRLESFHSSPADYAEWKRKAGSEHPSESEYAEWVREAKLGPQYPDNPPREEIEAGKSRERGEFERQESRSYWDMVYEHHEFNDYD
jgi:hypothetical protein